MNRSISKRRAKPKKVKSPPSQFAPAAFLSGSPEAVQQLCQELATQAASRFADLTGTTWSTIGTSIVNQLRAMGHDLSSFDQSEDFQEWQASWHHPRGNFSLFLSFRPPAAVEVTWKTDERTFSAHA